jgi:acyl-CoA synthetase (NDP forming)
VRDLKPLLAPASIAIVGASGRPNSVAAQPLANLRARGFSRPIYPVNPQQADIAGLACYPSLEALPQVPDLVLVVTPAHHVLPALEEAARLGVRAAVVISSGFAEAGAEGAAQQLRMGEIARAHGMIVCGPNSIGVLNYVDRIPISFTSSEDMDRHPAGRVALVSQSGGLMVSLANRFFDAGVGVSYAVATGNEADLTVIDALEYLAEQGSSDSLVLLVEEIREGPRFVALARRLLDLGKPLIAYKLGRTEPGSVAARSHTGALAGSYPVFRAVCRQLGVLEATELDDVLDLAATAAARRWPQGPGIGIVTGSGGGGAAAADRATELGLTVPSFGEASLRALRDFLPRFTTGNVENPFDATAQIIEDPSAAGKIAAVLLRDPAVDSVLMIDPGSGEPGRLRGAGLLEKVRETEKPVLQVVLSGSIARPMYSMLRAAGLPVFSSPAKAVEALAALRGSARAREREALRAASSKLDAGLRLRVRQALASAGPRPTEYGAKRFLAEFGIPVADDRLVHSPRDAVRAARELGLPVTLKIHSADITHKTEAGGVRLNLTDAKEIRGAYADILENVRRSAPEAKLDGMLVSPMIESKLDLISGFHTDSCFGPMVLLGLGGVWAEALGDVALRLAPLTAGDVAEMVSDLRAAKLLCGARGMPTVNMEQLGRVLLTLSDIAIAAGAELQDIDINPLVVQPSGEVIVVDASLFPASERQAAGHRVSQAVRNELKL